MKIVYTGLESAGKSLKLAMKCADLVDRNAKWYQQSGIQRSIWSNLKFSTEFEMHAESMGVPIQYWSNLDELIKLKDVDIIIDEIGTYFDARLWSDLSLDVRRWIAQGAKSGIEIYGSAQDFAQVDKAFRRLVNHVYEISKLLGSRRPSPTKPPVKRIWGICLSYELDPRAYAEDDKKYLSPIPDWFFIQRRYCGIFDTTQRIAESKPQSFKHIERTCDKPGCQYHVHGKIIHI